MAQPHTVPTEDELQEAAERLARHALRESKRATRSILARSNDPAALERALSVLGLVRALAPEDPLTETFATQLLVTCRRLLEADTAKPR